MRGAGGGGVGGGRVEVGDAKRVVPFKLANLTPSGGGGKRGRGREARELLVGAIFFFLNAWCVDSVAFLCWFPKSNETKQKAPKNKHSAPQSKHQRDGRKQSLKQSQCALPRRCRGVVTYTEKKRGVGRREGKKVFKDRFARERNCCREVGLG